jgi:hypothetical protein
MSEQPHLESNACDRVKRYPGKYVVNESLDNGEQTEDCPVDQTGSSYCGLGLAFNQLVGRKCRIDETDSGARRDQSMKFRIHTK